MFLCVAIFSTQEDIVFKFYSDTRFTEPIKSSKTVKTNGKRSRDVEGGGTET